MSRISRPSFHIGSRRHRRSRGQAVVEFALMLPVFLVFTLGVVDMARIFTSYISLTNGVANAALYAGSGGYMNWCTTSASTGVQCPASTPGGNSSSPDPANIAYQITVESTGLTANLITMSTPQCTRASDNVVVDCPATLPAEGTYSRVRISATYDMTMLTPLMTTLMGGAIHMSAATTAAIQ